MSKIKGIFDLRKNTFFSDEISSRQPINETVIIADAVLTNRAELLTKLGAIFSEQQKIADEQLILNSYKKWGEDCVEHLAGDFAFAIWDEQKKKLFCSRDHFGNSTLFYFKDSENFILASELKEIFNLKKIDKRFNKNKLAILLLPEPHTFASDETWFENVLPFPAGTSFSIDKDGIKIKKYWTPEIQKLLNFNKEEDLLEAFRELFFEVVNSYLENNKNPASLLSGGLDSSSIVSVAAKILEKQNRELNVFAAVLADENDSQFSDERFYIEQFRDFPNVKINFVSVPEKGPFSELEELFTNFHSPFITSRHYLYTAFNREAHRIGATRLFDGAFGETGATFHGTGGFAEMFAKLKWKDLWRELKLRKELYGDSIEYNIRANVINPVLPQFLINFKHGKPQKKSLINELHPINRNFARKLLENVDLTEYVRGRISPNTQKNQINELIFMQKKMADIPSSVIGRNPVELRYPFLDKRLIEFSLAIPLELKIRNGYYRYLIRASLDKILPPKIQWRTSKTPFSPDYMRRFNSQIQFVRDLLSDIKQNDPIREILDIERIKKWADLPIADSERYTTNEKIARDQIPQAVYLIFFLRQFSEFR